jgi:hypothetical protein
MPPGSKNPFGSGYPWQASKQPPLDMAINRRERQVQETLESAHILPRERILLLREHKKIHLYCTSGSVKAMQALCSYLDIIGNAIAGAEGRDNSKRRS